VSPAPIRWGDYGEGSFVYVNGVPVPLARINLSAIGSPVWVSGLRMSRNNVEDYIRWVETEALALQSNALKDERQRQPIRLWRIGESGKVSTAQDSNQCCWLQIMAFVTADNKVEIPLTDSEDHPLLCPLRPPLIDVRRPEASVGDWIDDMTGQYAVEWTDEGCDYRGTESWHASPEIAITASLRLVRQPRPHWVLTIENGRFQKDGAFVKLSQDQTVMVNLLGVGSSRVAEQHRVVGTFSTNGHYEVWREWRNAKVWNLQKHLEDNGIDDKNAFGAQLWGVSVIDAIALGANAPLYATDTGAVGGVHFLNGPIPPGNPLPMCRVRALSVPGAAPSVTVPFSNWVLDTRHRGMNDAGGVGSAANDPPMHSLNIALAQYHSVMIFDAINGRWYVQIYNGSTVANRGFGAWWVHT